MEDQKRFPTPEERRVRLIGWYPMLRHGMLSDTPDREEHMTQDEVQGLAQEFAFVMRGAFPRMFNPFDPCFHESLASVRRVAARLTFYADAMEDFAFEQQDELRKLAGIVDHAIGEDT